MAEDVEKPYETKAEAEEGKQSDSHGNGSGFVVDTRYIRSIEGILRLASIVSQFAACSFSWKIRS